MNNKPIVLFLISFIPFLTIEQTQAQASSPDSLRQALDTYPPPATWTLRDTGYFETALQLCDHYFQSMELDSLTAVSDSMLLLLSGISTDHKAFDSRIQYFNMRFSRFAGIAVIQQSNYPRALKYFQQYLGYAEKTGSVKDIGSAYTYLGYCHRAMNDFDLASQFAQKSMAVLKGSPYKSAMANNYTILSSCYSSVPSKLDSAVYYAKLANQIYHAEKNLANEVITFFDIAGSFALMFKGDSALYYTRKAEPFVFKMNAKNLIAQYEIRMGEAMYLTGRKNEALQHLKRAVELSKELGNSKFSFTAGRYLTLALALNGQRVEAIKSLEATIDAFEEEINAQKVKELNTAQLNFEFDKKQALADIELQRQKKIRDISLIGLGLGFLVALLLWRLYRQSRKTARILREKNIQIEKSYEALSATQAQLVLTEKQREAQSVRVRIARDIHDELGAGLTKITIMSDMLRKKLGDKDADTDRIFQRIVENSKAVSAALGEIVWAVNPAHDSLESLASYLKNYASHYLEGTGIEGIYHFPEHLPDKVITPELKRNIFLVLKESLNNAVKYAAANNIWVDFRSDGDTFQLLVRDNGAGFQPAMETQNGHHGNGLPNMKNRMEQLGCTFQLVSAPGQGCRIEASGKL